MLFIKCEAYLEHLVNQIWRESYLIFSLPFKPGYIKCELTLADGC